MSFSSLGLDPSLLENITRLGYTEATQVQKEAIPAVLTGADLLVSSQTGSGKTAAFVLPSLQRLRTPSSRPGRGPRMLVLCPTRELAMQVQKATHGYCSGQKLVTACLVGGMPYGAQLKQVQRRVDIVIATPGRLKDHMDRGSVELGRVEILVLDEADRMLDMGFQEELDAIVAKAPKERQTLLFSATLSGVVGHLARRVTRDPKRVEVKRREETKPDITQHALYADNQAHKGRMLDSLLRETEVEQALVFTATKRTAAELTEALVGKGFTAGALHGDMKQKERSRTLMQLREGKMRVLVATDVAARGLDIDGITHVVNFEVPSSREMYVHRVGRTGRAGRAGVGVTLVLPDQQADVSRVARLAGHTEQFASGGMKVAPPRRVYSSRRGRSRWGSPAPRRKI